jgi:hypothetical protein
MERDGKAESQSRVSEETREEKEESTIIYRSWRVEKGYRSRTRDSGHGETGTGDEESLWAECIVDRVRSRVVRKNSIESPMISVEEMVRWSGDN